MAFEYTAWPTSANLLSYVQGILPNVYNQVGSVNTSVLNLLIAGASKKIEQDTGRQFVATADTRYFDGSGTGQQVLDDYVSIDVDTNGLYKVYLFIQPGQLGSSNLQFGYINEVAEPQPPKNIIQIYQGPPIVAYSYFTSFPQGRSNVQVYGVWGYAATIPEDVFEAVLAMSANKLVNGIQMGTAGIQTGWKEGDVDETFSPTPWWKASGWSDLYQQTVSNYKRDILTILARRKVPQY